MKIIWFSCWSWQLIPFINFFDIAMLTFVIELNSLFFTNIILFQRTNRNAWRKRIAHHLVFLSIRFWWAHPHLMSSPIDFPFHLAPPELRALFREDFHIRRTSLSWAWKDDIGDYPEVGAPLCALEPVQLPTCVCGCMTPFCYTTRLFHHNSLKSLKWQHGQWSLCMYDISAID